MCNFVWRRVTLQIGTWTAVWCVVPPLSSIHCCWRSTDCVAEDTLASSNWQHVRWTSATMSGSTENSGSDWYASGRSSQVHCGKCVNTVNKCYSRCRRAQSGKSHHGTETVSMLVTYMPYVSSLVSLATRNIPCPTSVTLATEMLTAGDSRFMQCLINCGGLLWRKAGTSALYTQMVSSAWIFLCSFLSNSQQCSIISCTNQQWLWIERMLVCLSTLCPKKMTLMLHTIDSTQINRFR